MSFNRKDRERIDFDKLNIKSHLNASLEEDGINVSEELIRRTLDAIRMHEANEPDAAKDIVDHKKTSFVYRHARMLVTAAAAVLILAAGLNAIRMLSPMKTKMDMAESEYASDSDGSGSAELYGIMDAPKDDVAYDMDKREVLKSANRISEDTVEGSTEDTADEEQTVDMGMKIRPEEQEEASGFNAGLTSVQEMLAFTDITHIEAADINTVIISDGAEVIKTISDRKQIDEFYTIMQKHSFIFEPKEDTAVQYIIKLTSENRDTQVIIGGASVTVDYTKNDITSHSVYITANHTALIQDIEELMINLSN